MQEPWTNLTHHSPTHCNPCRHDQLNFRDLDPPCLTTCVWYHYYSPIASETRQATLRSIPSQKNSSLRCRIPARATYSPMTNLPFLSQKRRLVDVK
uniref:Uncharacterized protein n=1 Tax=Rhizophora mucronata TaxID=61149 RepID=A0A2P2P8E3_RHIMU